MPVRVHTRRRLSAALACLAAIAVLAGVPLAYAGQVLSDSGQFSARATTVLDNPSVRSLIAARVAAQAIRSDGVSAAFAPAVTRAVDVAIGTAAFRRIFTAAVADLHRSVFVGGSDTVTLRLAHVGKLVLDALRRTAPALAARVPASVSRQVTRISGGDLGQATRVARGVERAHTIGVLLLIVAGLVFLLAIAQASERRRAAGQVGLALLVDGVVLVAAYALARLLVLDRFAAGDDRSAAGAVWNAFLSGLRSDAVLLAAAGAVVAAVMVAVSGFRRSGGAHVSAGGGARRAPIRPEPRRSRPGR